MKQRVASFLVPVLTAVILLYQVVTDLRIAVLQGATLWVIGLAMLAAAVAGLLAAFGPAVVRVGVLVACTLLFLDVSFHLSGAFDHLRPEGRTRVSRDEKRIADMHRIKAALDQYTARIGPLPSPMEYGEEAGVPSFWNQWWDISSRDGNQDGAPFLGFLTDAGILPSVPVDPVNRSPDGDPRHGQQYVYYLVPPAYQYQGGTCDARPDRWHYLIGVTDLEEETRRPPARAAGSGCDCLWKNKPNFFQQHFDYVLCGAFDTTQASRALEAVARKKRAEAAEAARQPAAVRAWAAQDQRRVSDIHKIQQGLESYLKNVGPLPRPVEYGEAEQSGPGFWRGRWDVSTQDGDGDGISFLDFLVDSGTMPSVPVDPENQPAVDGDLRNGRQYAYIVVTPGDDYEGGIGGAHRDQSVYLLGITDLRSEHTRPPTKIAGSGCEMLWRDEPNFFQQQFDYVVCGTFDGSPAARARAAKIREAAMNAEARAHLAEDQRRVADLHQIQQALQKYLATVGPLPAPADYGESENSTRAGFWRGYWDVSGEDGDGDGRPFLDFLAERGIMPSVPVDPENQRAEGGDPRGGRQYVYTVMAPTDTYEGGSCAAGKKEWVYLLGITDLRSEITRPPKNLSGSGCECLWRNAPNYFQQQFDYVVCGRFTR
jgi:hypothetical protein